MNESHKQLPLDFKNKNNSTYAEFLIEGNNGVIKGLNAFSESSAYIFFLWGSSGCGKSHLLHAFINEKVGSDKQAVLVQPKDLVKRENVSLIAMFEYICIDNVHRISGDVLLEEALFFWINEIKQYQKKLILASQIPNSDNQWKLADLRSRLASGITHQLKPLSRSGVLEAFLHQAKVRGLNIDAKVINYLENNCAMNMSFLKNLIIALDKATLIQKKQVTIPLIKNILQTELVN
ncbi:MAG: DnaA/Hda family protein [Marinicellaceae bacterium]